MLMGQFLLNKSMLEYDAEKRSTAEDLFKKFRENFPNQRVAGSDSSSVISNLRPLTIGDDTVCYKILFILTKFGN